MTKILLSTFCFLTLWSYGQIVISRQHLPIAGVKQHIKLLTSESNTNISNAFNIGQASDQPQIWLLNPVEAEEDSVEYMEVGQTPYANEIDTNAQFAMNLDNNLGSAATSFTDNYLFLDEYNGGLYGNAIALNAMGETVVLFAEDPELIFPFPMQYGNVFLDTSTYKGSINSVLGNIEFSRVTTKSIKVDAFGFIVLDNDSIAVIRVHEEAHIADDFGTVTNTIEHRYHFYANEPNYRHPVVSVFSGNDNVIDAISWISFPKNITQEEDSTNNEDVEDSTVIIDSSNSIFEWENQPQIVIYPNPAKDQLKININNSQLLSVDINIFNFLGQTLYHSASNFNGTSEEIYIDVLDFEPGAYFIEFKVNNQKSMVHRFQISR